MFVRVAAPKWCWAAGVRPAQRFFNFYFIIGLRVDVFNYWACLSAVGLGPIGWFWDENTWEICFLAASIAHNLRFRITFESFRSDFRSKDIDTFIFPFLSLPFPSLPFLRCHPLSPCQLVYERHRRLHVRVIFISSVRKIKMLCACSGNTWRLQGLPHTGTRRYDNYWLPSWDLDRPRIFKLVLKMVAVISKTSRFYIGVTKIKVI